MKKILLSAFGRDAIFAISQIVASKYEWKTSYITVDRNDVEYCSSELPGVIVHSIQDLRRGVKPSLYQPKNKFVFDKISFDFVKSYEQVFLSMADRMDKDGFKFSYTQRRRHFIDVVGYWANVLLELEIDFVISRNVPHFPGEYGLYIACQMLSRTFLMADRMASLGRSWVISSIENRSKPIARECDSRQQVIVAHRVKTVLGKLREKYDIAVPDYFKKRRGKAKQEGKRSFFYLYWLCVHFIVLFPTALRMSNMTLKMNHRPLSDDRSMPNRLQSFIVQLDARRRIKKNLAVYEGLSESVDFEKPYVYFAPNYQPERTTYPDAGVFGDVLLMLDILASLIPDDWVIYFKDHPSVFSLPNSQLFWRGHMYRNEEFYMRANSYSNVKLVHHETDSFSLIDGAQFTTTATGTVALESVARSTPALVFGSVWFDKAEGVTRFKKKEDISNLIDNIRQGYKPDAGKLAEYLQVCWDHSSVEYTNLLQRDTTSAEKASYDTEIERVVSDFAIHIARLNSKENRR